MLFKRRKNNTTLGEHPILELTRTSYDGVDVSLTKKKLSVSYDEAQTSVIFFGTTSSGKTASGLKPILRNLLENDCSGLILDVKGDYVSLLRSEFMNKVKMLGPGSDCDHINLVSGMSRPQFMEMISNLSLRHSTNNGTWGTAAVRDAMLIYDLMINSEQRPPTLGEIFYFFNRPREFCDHFDAFIESSGDISPNLNNSFESATAESFSILAIGESKAFFKAGGKTSEKDKEQFTWHAKMLKSHLAPFADPDIEGAFCDASAPPLSCYEDVLQGKTICLDINMSRYAGAAHSIALILKERFYQGVFSRNPHESLERLGPNRKTFMMIDEYQSFVSQKDDGIDDNRFFDKSRAYGHLNILAVQGVQSLISRIEEDTTRSILQNIRTKVFMATDDKETLRYVKELDMDPRYLLLAEKGAAIIYKGANATTKPYCEYAMATKYEPDTPLSYDSLNQPCDSTEDEVSAKVPNPYYTVKMDDPNCEWKIIFPEKGSVISDFETAFHNRMEENLERLGGKIDRYEKAELLGFARRKIARCPVPANHESSAVLSTIKRAVEIKNDDPYGEEFKRPKHQNLILIRGGGKEIRHYSTPTIVRFIEHLKEKDVVSRLFVGLGHTPDNPRIHRIADEKTETPTSMGWLMADTILRNFLIGIQDPDLLSPEDIKALPVSIREAVQERIEDLKIIHTPLGGEDDEKGELSKSNQEKDPFDDLEDDEDDREYERLCEALIDPDDIEDEDDSDYFQSPGLEKAQKGIREK